MVMFRESDQPIPVYLQSMTLGFYDVDSTLIPFTMTIGLIPTVYNTTAFFNQPTKGALGLLPTNQSDLNLQFTWVMQ